MASFETTDGYTVQVDDADFDKVAQFRWVTRENRTRWRTTRYVSATHRRRPRLLLHRFLMEPTDDEVVDHRNHDGLDNRRDNLRVCTSMQNSHNRRPWLEASSCFKGVSFHPASNKWQAIIMVNKRSHYIGLFSSELNAAYAYDVRARELHGEFAYVNFPNEHRQPTEHRRGRAGYRGVTYARHLDKWSAVICVGGGKQKHIGVYATPEEAARAYDAQAKVRFGDIARLNFPDAATVREEQ